MPGRVMVGTTVVKTPRVAMPPQRAASSSAPGRGSNEIKARAEDLQRVVLAANSDGIDLLRRGKPLQAYEQLKFAEAVLAANPATCAENGDLLALTCSNLGCYYRKKGLPRASLRYLGRALRVEEAAARDAPHDACGLATTKLNACAALSGMGNHEEAEKLAVEATRLLVVEGGEEGDAPPGREACALLAVACHNLGAEREHLGQWGAAAMAFRHGAEAAVRALGPRSDLARSLADSCAEALEKAERHPTTMDHLARIRVSASPRQRQWRHGAGTKASTSTPRRPVNRMALDPAAMRGDAFQVDYARTADFPMAADMAPSALTMVDGTPMSRVDMDDEEELDEDSGNWRTNQVRRNVRLPIMPRSKVNDWKVDSATGSPSPL